jgi:hypothetical protein
LNNYKIDSITIENTYGIIIAENVWGALNGLETFSQLVFFTEENYVRILFHRKKWAVFVIVSNQCFNIYS